MSEVKVVEPAVATDANPTSADADAMAAALLSEPAGKPADAKEPVTEPAKEPESKDAKAGTESGKVEVDAADYLKIKRQAGRVDSLQREQSELAKQLAAAAER